MYWYPIDMKFGEDIKAMNPDAAIHVEFAETHHTFNGKV